MLRSNDINDTFHKLLMEIFDLKRALFPPAITSHKLILRHYQCYGTFRRSSDTRVIDQGVSSADIDIVNIWKLFEGSKSKVPAYAMQQRYAQFNMLLAPFLRYTKDM